MTSRMSALVDFSDARFDLDTCVYNMYDLMVSLDKLFANASHVSPIMFKFIAFEAMKYMVPHFRTWHFSD